MHARVEFVRLRQPPDHLSAPLGVLSAVYGAATLLTVSGTATVAGTRPVAPAGAQYARITAIGGNAVVSWGADPTATQANGVVILENGVELVPVTEGHLVSLIELSLS